MDKKVRVRFAPSPTGPLHIGGVRTALFNYLFAKKHGGDFILRIEDTDRLRYVEGTEEYILKAFSWCGIEYTEGFQKGGDLGPYKQSERKDIYSQYAKELVSSGKAYYAFDTPEEIETMRQKLRAQGIASPQYDAVTRTYMKNSLTLSADEVKERMEKGEPYVIRINVPRKEEIRLEDKIRGWVIFQSKQLDDKVLFKADGMPTYHLANVVDDHLMKITHVIRGEEWLPSTPIHVLLYRYLGWESQMPEFAHLPLLLRPDGKGKLSKRDGELSGFPVYPIKWIDPVSKEQSAGYKETGFFPEAFINILAFLGWNPGTKQELFTIEELITAFSMERVGKAGAKFDYEKAKWFNQQYIKSKDNKTLANLFKPILKNKGCNNEDEYIEKVCALLKERATFISDFWDTGSYFFTAPEKYDQKVIRKKWKEDTPDFLKELQQEIEKTEPFQSAAIESKFKSLLEKYDKAIGAVLPVFRLALTGMGFGPPLFEIAELIGKEETMKRINKALSEIKADKID